MAPAKKKKKKQAEKADPDGKTVVATNRRARFDYEIVDTWEAGIQLWGPEVKALRRRADGVPSPRSIAARPGSRRCTSPYEPATRANPTDPQRRRKLLLHRHEIDRMDSRVTEKGSPSFAHGLHAVGARRSSGARAWQASPRQARVDQAARGGPRSAARDAPTHAIAPVPTGRRLSPARPDTAEVGHGHRERGGRSLERVVALTRARGNSPAIPLRLHLVCASLTSVLPPIVR